MPNSFANWVWPSRPGFRWCRAPSSRSAIPRQAEKVAREIGFPLIVKAAFGGGGRGMRVVEHAADFAGLLEEARREAAAAFGNDAVFIERFVRRARHIEVQILGDRHGDILHLYERDCSVQRRHQKVVEVAPAVALDPGIRAALAAGRRHAGPRGRLLQRRHGGVPGGRRQRRVVLHRGQPAHPGGAHRHRNGDRHRPGALPDPGGAGPGAPRPGDEPAARRTTIPLYGYALQCRITTEDPSNGFVPDYGKLSTYRSPAGFGIRLDGGSAYSGAVITPYYDSLLVKTTAWGREFRHACQRMDRCLREFRVRGVKTNIPFLENVVNHADFQAGRVTTRWLEETPALFRFATRRDRATRLLSYLGDVIVNGNPTVAGKPRPRRIAHAAGAAATIPRRRPRAPANSCSGSVPEGFAQWTLRQKGLLLTDTTFRDAHQSLLATRVRTYDMLAIANFVSHRLHHLYSLEMWGGATFDVTMRFLHEDPFARLRQLRQAIPNICFQMLLRASNAVGYTAYPDNVVAAFIQEASAQGIDIFRIFDSLNWLPNMKASMEAVRRRAACARPPSATPATSSIRGAISTRWQYYVRMAKELERMGAHILAIKDMAGLCKPYAAEKLVKALRREVGIPIHFHTHDTSGINAASVLKAARRGRARGRRRGGLHERADQPAQPQLDCGGAGPHPARRAASRSTPSTNTPIIGKWCASSTPPSTPVPGAAPPKSTSTRCPAASTPISRSRPNPWAWACAGTNWPAPMPMSTWPSGTS